MNNNRLKVAVIGGGSSYTPELIEGFIKRHHEFPVTDLFLADIQEGEYKLKVIGDLARRMIEKSGLPIRVHLTLDRREAIQDAQFVLTQIRVGLLGARARDERIPLRYGCIGQETTGAGGFAKAIRTIPVILEICKEMEELAPNAFLINFTNPAGVITEAVTKYSNIRTVGLCNLPIHTRMQIAQLLEVEPHLISVEMVGINHLNWIRNVYLNDEDITDRVLDLFIRGEGFSVKNVPNYRWGKAFLESLGMIPCSYLRYYYLKDQMLKNQLDLLSSEGTRADTVKKVEDQLFEIYKDPGLNIKPQQLEQRGGAYYSEAAIDLVTSIYNDKKDVQIVNVKNNGVIKGLSDDASIEVSCVISAQGASPLQLQGGQLPTRILGLLQVVKAYEELTVKAGAEGDYDSALQALTIHPLVGSAPTAEHILKDILVENQLYLPQF